MPDLDGPELEAVFRGLLSSVAAKHVAASQVRPDQPSPDYATGYRDGFEAGQVAAMAFSLGAHSGESPTRLIEQAVAQARVEAAFPFELHIDPAEIDATSS